MYLPTDLAAPVPREAEVGIGALVSGMRIRQWAKNLLLFAGLLFAARLGDATRWLEAGGAFAAYCFASSAAYLVNDVRDVEADRLHPTKCNRPVASGAVSTASALTAAAMLLGAAVAIAAALGAASLGFLLGFAALQIAYSTILKRVSFLDVVTIAGLFVLRAAAGAEVINVRISPWLLGCTALLALFLALAKRRAELLLVHATATPGRAALAHYSVPLVNRLLLAAAGAALGGYSLYAFTSRDSAEMAATIPLVAVAVGRYLVLIRCEGVGEEPERVLLGDLPILATVAVWAVTCGLILSLS